MNIRILSLALPAAALFVIGYFPILRIIFQKWSASEEYSHAFLTLPIIVFMIWQKRSAIRFDNVRFSRSGLMLLSVATLFYFFALLTQVQTLILLAMLMAVLGIALYLGGWESFKALFTPLLLIALLIPPPEQFYIQLTAPLQLLVSQAAEIIVRATGLSIFRDGNIMTIPSKSFEVVEACSGMRSMMTLLTLSIIMGYFLLSNNGFKAILAVASVPAAIFINIVRVVAIILLYHFYRLDLTEGSSHTLLGLATFGLALIILYLLHLVLEKCQRRL